MAVDVFIAILFGIMVFLGWRSGALSQAIRIGAAIAVVVASPFVAIIIRETLFGESDIATPWMEMTSMFLAGILIYVALVVAGWLVVKTMRAASPTLSKVDRAGGALIGSLKAAVIVYFVLVLVLTVQVSLEKHDANNALRLRGGYATAFVERYNILFPWQFPDLKILHQALRTGVLAEKHGKQSLVRDDARAADILRKASVQELLADEALMEAVVADRYPITLADERVRVLLNDKDFVRELRSVAWSELLEAVSDEAEKDSSAS